MSPVSLMAGLALALCGQAAATFTRHFGGSVATCDIRAVSKSSSLSVSVASSAMEKVDAVLCGPDEDVHKNATSSAQAIATAFAEAITEVVANCYASGHASFQVRGKSVASAQAHAIAQAYAAAYVTANTCHKCSAVSELVVESYEDIFLNATSEATVELEAITKGGEVSAASDAFTSSFLNKTVVAFSQVIIDARAAADSCEVAAVTETKVGDVEDSNGSVCKIGVVTSDDEQISNGAVAISTSVSARACGKGFASATFEVEAEALGKVMAIAVSQISGDCHVKGNGTACVLAKAHITKTAEAVATAFAQGYASATEDCADLCNSNATVLSDAIGSVLATATSEVYEQQCDGPESYFDITALDKEIVKATTTALASILTNVSVSTSGECVIEVDVETSVTPSPQQVVTDHTVHPKHDKGISEPAHPEDKDVYEPAHPEDQDVSEPHHHDVGSPAKAPVKDDHDVVSKPVHPPVKEDNSGDGHKEHSPRKPIKNIRRKHGQVKHQKSAKHRDQNKRQPKRRIAKKRATKKSKKMIKYKKGPHRRPVGRKSMKVRPTKQRIRAAQLALARKRAQAMRRRASKGNQSRRSPGRGKHARRIRKRAPRRRRSRGSRKPRHG